MDEKPSVTEEYDAFVQEATLAVYERWGKLGGRELTPAELQELNTLLDEFFIGVNS